MFALDREDNVDYNDQKIYSSFNFCMNANLEFVVISFLPPTDESSNIE